MIPLPFGIEFAYWASVVAEIYSQYGIITVPQELAWRVWATEFVSVPDLMAEGLPDPQQFADWRLWASRIIEVLV